jgi:lipopolysaccharide export LptBFGC system permease protein LptF
MNNKSVIVVIFIFLISLIVFITFFSVNPNSFGESFVEQIRIADSENTFSSTNDEKLIQIGKDICTSSNLWKDEQKSLEIIYNLLAEYNFKIEADNRIIPILRFQSTYELCPENISVLEGLFSNEK